VRRGAAGRPSLSGGAAAPLGCVIPLLFLCTEELHGFGRP